MRLLHSLLSGPRHEQDREDIASRALAKLVSGIIEDRLPSFNQMSTFGDVVGMTWKIVSARAVEFFRSRERRPEDLMEDVPEVPVTGADSSPALSWDECEELINKLPPPQPEIFKLHYVEGHTAEEISARLGKPRGTILNYLFRGRKTLRDWLVEREDDSRDRDTDGSSDHESNDDPPTSK